MIYFSCKILKNLAGIQISLHQLLQIEFRFVTSIGNLYIIHLYIRSSVQSTFTFKIANSYFEKNDNSISFWNASPMFCLED